MRILVAAASFSSELSGVQRHAFNLVRSLLLQSRVSAIDLVVAPWQRELVQKSGLEANDRLMVHAADMQDGPLSRNRWYYSQLPPLAERLSADVVHLSYPVLVNAKAFTCPVVVTLHDLYPYEIPANFGFNKAVFNRLILQQCLRSVDAITCVSDTTLLQLGKYVPQQIRQRAQRIYNCVEPEPHLESLVPGGGFKPFLLSVAQHRRNKNIPFLLRVFKRLIESRELDPSIQLVVVGIPGPETGRILYLIERLGLHGRVRLMNGLREPQLQWCYRNCELLVTPSKIEGFGLPVAEALLAGCRIVCSDIPALREVGGPHCRYVALHGPAETAFAAAISSALREPRQVPCNFPELSAPVIAAQYVRLYTRLLDASSLSRPVHSSHSIPATATERPVL